MEAASASCWFGFTTVWRKCSARRRESTQINLSGKATAIRAMASRMAGVTTPP